MQKERAARADAALGPAPSTLPPPPPLLIRPIVRAGADGKDEDDDGAGARYSTSRSPGSHRRIASADDASVVDLSRGSSESSFSNHRGSEMSAFAARSSNAHRFMLRSASAASTGSTGSGLGHDELQRSSSLTRNRINALRVVATPFTSPRYSHFSVERRLDVGNAPGAAPSLGPGTIACRLDEVKRLVAAGMVKQSVYDQLVGVNQSDKKTDDGDVEGKKEATKTLAAPLSSMRENQAEDSTLRSGASINITTTTSAITPPLNSRVTSRDTPSHSRAHTTPAMMKSARSSPTLSGSNSAADSPSSAGTTTTTTTATTKHSPLRHRPTRSMGAMLSRLLTGMKLSRPTSSDAPSLSPLDLRVVAPAMLNYKVTLTHTEKAADLQGNLFTLFVASVEYNDETIREIWVIRRRYRVFASLNKAIRRELATSPLLKSVPKFPGKHGISAYLAGEKFLVQRRERIDAWLEGVICLSTRSSVCAQMLQEFLHAADDDGEDSGSALLDAQDSSVLPSAAVKDAHAAASPPTDTFRNLVLMQHQRGELGEFETNTQNASSQIVTQRKVSVEEQVFTVWSPIEETDDEDGGKNLTRGDVDGKEKKNSVGVDQDRDRRADRGRLGTTTPLGLSTSPPRDNNSQIKSKSVLMEDRDAQSPVPPEIPTRPDALSGMKFKKSQLSPSARRPSPMITEAIMAASRASMAAQKRRTMQEPERKIVKGPEGYRYEWRIDLAPVQHYMWKRGGFRGGNKNWKRRWLVLKQNAIFYYRTSKPKLLGTVPLDANSSVVVLDGVACPKDVPNNHFAFVVKTGSRHLYIYTDVESVRRQWKAAVAEAVQNLRGTIAASRASKMENAAVQSDADVDIKKSNSTPPLIPSVLPPPSQVVSPTIVPSPLDDDTKTQTAAPALSSSSSATSEAARGRATIENNSARTLSSSVAPTASANANTATLSFTSGETPQVPIPPAPISPAPTRDLPEPSFSDLDTPFGTLKDMSSKRRDTAITEVLSTSDEMHARTLGRSLSSAEAADSRHAQSRSVSVGSFRSLPSGETSARSHWELDKNHVMLGEKLGKGAFGVVYQGTLWGTDVAIKKLYSEALSLGTATGPRTLKLQHQRDQLLKDLKNEVRILSQLRHPNVVLYMGVCTQVPDVFIVTELCPRRSLFEVIHDPSVALSCELRLRMALQAAQGMAYLHSQPARIIHRDLKSHNLLVGENFEIKVADFGLTVVRNRRGGGSAGGGQKSNSFVASGDREDTGLSLRSDAGGHYGIHGTPQWMAPEVMEGSPYNGKVDVYSYGIVLCEIFSRMLPFSDRYHAFQFIEAVLEQGATPTIPRWCFSGRGAAIRAIGLRREMPPWDETGGGNGSDSDGEDNPVRQSPLELPSKIQTLRRGTLRKVVLQCLDRDPKQRPSFDHVVELLREVLMPGEGAEAAVHLGARVFLEFDLPRIVEAMRDSAMLLASPPTAANGRSRASVFSSRLLHGAAVCREVDDLFTAMAQSQRGLPTCSDDHRYMSIQRPALSLTHAMTKRVNDLLANHLIDLLDAVTGWISRNGAIAASYEPVSVLWDVLGAIEALVRMQDPWLNRAHGRAMRHPLERRRQSQKRLRRKAGGGGGAAAKVKTSGVVTVLRDAGVVASIIALFALLPSMDDEEKEEEGVIRSDITQEGEGEGKDEEDEDYFQDYEQTDDEMLREHLSRAADLGGSILLIMSRLDADIALDAERAIAESIEELMSLTDMHIPPLLRRFQEYLPNVPIPPQLKERRDRTWHDGLALA